MIKRNELKLNVTSNGSHFPDTDRNVFASSEWGSAYGDSFLPLAVGNDTDIKATLALFWYERLGKKVVINPPLSLDCGLSFLKQPEKRYARNSEVKHVMRSLAQYLNKNYSGAYIDIAFPPGIVDVQPFIEEGFTTGVMYTYRLELGPTEDELLSGLSAKRRKNVQDAIKDGLTVEINGEVDEIVNMVGNTWKNAGLKFNPSLMRNVLAKDLTYTISIRDTSKLLATSVIAVDSNCAYYIAGGILKNENNSGAGSQALWEAIKMAKKMNIPVFDFCGSTVPSIEKFFRGYGGELIPFFRVKNNHKLFDILKSTKDKISSL